MLTRFQNLTYLEVIFGKVHLEGSIENLSPLLRKFQLNSWMILASLKVQLMQVVPEENFKLFSWIIFGVCLCLLAKTTVSF